MGFIFLLVGFLLSLALWVWAFFEPVVPAMVFLSIAGALWLFLVAADRTRLPPPKELFLDKDGLRIFQRHHIFLRLPDGAGLFCMLLQSFRWSALLWCPLLVFKDLWWHAGTLAMYFFITGSIAVRLRPIEPYAAAAAEGNREIARELHILQTILRQLYATDETA